MRLAGEWSCASVAPSIPHRSTIKPPKRQAGMEVYLDAFQHCLLQFIAEYHSDSRTRTCSD